MQKKIVTSLCENPLYMLRRLSKIYFELLLMKKKSMQDLLGNQNEIERNNLFKLGVELISTKLKRGRPRKYWIVCKKKKRNV